MKVCTIREDHVAWCFTTKESDVEMAGEQMALALIQECQIRMMRNGYFATMDDDEW